MYDRLSWHDHQTARSLGREASDGNTAAWEQLRAMTARQHPDLGERFVCPSEQTVAYFADAVAAWAA